MIKKEIAIGVIVGLVANGIGLFLATMILGDGDGFTKVLYAARVEGFLGKLMSLGAILNLVAFFIFIKRKQDYRARGVLLATMIVAIASFLVKL